MDRRLAPSLRPALLGIKGVGPETADSILLYALDKPTFVVDAYTFRILSRHGLIHEGCAYEELRHMFMEHLAADVRAALVSLYQTAAAHIKCGSSPAL